MEYHRARLNYQFSKLEPIRNGVFPEFCGNTEFELFSFYEICYHLKDWIIKSPNYSSLKNVENFINDSPSLRICADICNRLKHKTLTKRPRSKSQLGIFKLSSTITVGPDPSHAKVSLDKATIETERGEECCYALAEQCMKEWERYFAENGI
jgi:hypothetical protein